MRRRASLLSILLSLSLTWAAACSPTFDGDQTLDELPPMSLPPPECRSLTACGRACVDLQNDPQSCGSCDRTCVIPNAVAACKQGQCAIAACHDGFFDSDRKLENGCETMSQCVPGAECQTQCDSTGTTVCNSGTLVCAAPAETCNAIDDDCNGACDEGTLPGCRTGVHRALGNGGHFYTTDLNAAMSPPFSLEAANYFRIYAAPAPGTQPMYLCDKGRGLFFLTGSPTCEALNVTGRLLGYWATEARCGAQPLYRLYQPMGGDHFYTVSDPEKQSAIDMYGYRFEGIAAYVWLAP